ncbi:MAG TPA: hypothetical protein VHN77_08885 [Phycisphaerales bacterium]|nr:hypothetical protein [Phycisphaerales bacterium]
MRVRALQRSMAALLALAGSACVAAAQTTFEGPGSGELRFLVFDPAAAGGQGEWVRSMGAQPGQQVEWRVDMVYTGTRSDLFALGEVLYQPTIANADNMDGGDGIDALGPWGPIPPQCDFVPCDSSDPQARQALARLGTPLQAYGRVNFGGMSQSATGSNILTAFRHSNGSNGAPPGEWIRIAGSFVTLWPGPLNTCPVTATDINRILRGVSSQQQSSSLAPFFHMPGLSPTIFRQALVLSDRPDARVIEIGTFPEAFRRVGGTASCDDRRYSSWQTGTADSGSHRTLYPTISPAFVFITGTACDPIDFNRDTLFPDVQDIADFLAVYSGGACPTGACGDIDFNNDWLFPDTADIESLVSVFAGGPCL